MLRRYLTQDNLAGNPWDSSPWTHLHKVGNNRAFIIKMGVDVCTFETLLLPFELVWGSLMIPRSDVNPYGAPQPAQRSLDAAGGLALLLHWMSSTMAGCTWQKIFFNYSSSLCKRSSTCPRLPSFSPEEPQDFSDLLAINCWQMLSLQLIDWIEIPTALKLFWLYRWFESAR